MLELTHNETGQLIQLVRTRMKQEIHSPHTMPQLKSIESKLLNWLDAVGAKEE